MVGMENPILRQKQASLERDSDFLETGGAEMSKQSTFDARDSKRAASVFFVVSRMKEARDGIRSAFESVASINFEMQMYKTHILMERSFFALVKREKLLVGSTLVAIAFSVLIGIILGESTNESGSVTGSCCIGALMIIISNVQFVFFLYGTNEVRLCCLLLHTTLYLMMCSLCGVVVWCCVVRCFSESTREDCTRPSCTGS
jgi:hypothetical protein